MDGNTNFLRELSIAISRNKNILMLTTVFIYIWALIATLNDKIIPSACIITFLLIIFLIKKYFPIKYIITWILIFYIGIINTSLRIKDTDVLLNIAPVNCTISGKILSIPQKKANDKQVFFFKVDELDLEGKKLTFKKEKVLVSINTLEQLNRFDTYQITGRLSIPFKAGNPYQFDYSNYLRNFGIYSVFYGKEFTQIDAKCSKFEKLLQSINNYREKIIAIHSNYLKSPNLEILGGIVFGDDAVSAPEDIKQSFINSGLLHILAASGMNVAFIYSFFFLILSLFKVNFRANICISIAMILIYTLMTGLGSSVIRASLMLIFVLIGKLIDRDAHSIALLSFVGFLMLLYNPMYINDVGFQLSFIVTFGLLIMTPYITDTKNKIKNWILGTILIPLIAQLWVIPVQIYYFNNISVYSIFANIMSMPILAIISFGGFISSLLSIITPIANFICLIFDFILNPLLSMLVNISNFWGHLPNATISINLPNTIQIVAYYIILITITALFNKQINKKYKKLLKLLLIFLFCSILITGLSYKDKNAEITAFDVGNADAFLIKTPNDKYFMIDTGKSGYNGGKTQAEIILLNYLKNSGVKKLDSLIISHFDNDHCGGAIDIMENIKVDNLFINNINHSSTSANNIITTAKKLNIKIQEAHNNQVVYQDNNFLIKNFITKLTLEKDDNESSILTLVEYDNFKMLFSGDASASTLEKLRNLLPKNITILKIGHHGADGVINKQLLYYLNPKVSLISVGQNKFGHPAITTLDHLKNTNILRTDINNCIRFIINKNGYNILTYDIPSKKFHTYKDVNKDLERIK